MLKKQKGDDTMTNEYTLDNYVEMNEMAVLNDDEMQQVDGGGFLTFLLVVAVVSFAAGAIYEMRQ